MPRSTPYSLWMVMLLMGLSFVSRAQESLPVLELRKDRMIKAKAVEDRALRTHDSLLLAEAWYLYGKTYVFAGDFRVAQTYFLKSLRIQEPRGNSFELSRLYVRLSETESIMGDTKKALYYARLSMNVAQRIHSDEALIRSYGGLAHLYESIWGGDLVIKGSHYARVLYCYRKAEELCYKLKDTAGIAEAQLNLGRFFTNMKDPQAILYLQKAVQTFTLKNKEGVRVNAMVHLSAAYLAFNKPALALQTLREAEGFYNARHLKEYDLRLNLERTFVDYFQATRQWKAAFQYIKKLNDLERSQLMANRDGAISRLNIEYETQKKEALLRASTSELSLRTQNLQSQQRFTAAMSALFIMATGMSLIFFRLYRKNRRISQQNEYLVKEQNHRVKNNLQVISSLLNLQSKRLTDETAKRAVEESRLRIESMAIIHRRLYDGDQRATVSLDEFVRELTEGVLVAYGYGSVQPQYAIDDQTLDADRAVPVGLILNELITNACKYAFPYTSRPELIIRCQRRDKKIEVEVTDNGPGLDGDGRADDRLRDNGQTGEVLVVQQKSFGMQLIQAQVRQLSGSYQFHSNAKATLFGTRFTMEFNA